MTQSIESMCGASRGAQLHHFPTKGELVAAAVEHTLSQRMEQLRGALADPPPDADIVQLSIDMMWAMFQGAPCIAWVELAVAARTDDALRPHVRAVGERHRQAALFDGLVLHRMSSYDEGPDRAEAVVEAAKGVAAMMFPSPAR